jgi:hypothetical protein
MRNDGTLPSLDPHGQVALMLCESLLHILVEEGVITKEKAIDAIETVAEVTRQMAENGKGPRTARPGARQRRNQARGAVNLIEAIMKSLVAKGPP